MAKTSITAKLGLDTTAFQRGMAKSQKSVSKFAKSATASFVRMGAAFAGIGLVKSIIGLGTSAAETASKFNAVFGPSADAMNEKILELKKNIPATTQEMQNALSTFGAMATAFGLNKQAADEFSVNMVKIAGDLASFHDMKPEEAFLKIRSAISGEFEPMKQLGIVLNEAILKQEALNLKIWDGQGAMSAAQKALVVQSLLIKQMGVANGDAAATAESAANQIKFLQSKLKDTGAEIGQNILPAVVKLTGWFSKLTTSAKQSAEAVGGYLAGGGKRKSDLGPDNSFRIQARKNALKDANFTKMSAADRMKWLVAEEKRLDKAFYDKGVKREEERKAARDQKKAEDGVTEAIADPDRQKAADDYLASLQAQITAAGTLKGITKATTKNGAPTPTEAAAVKRLDPNSFRAREIAAGLHNTTLGRDGRKLDAMVDKGAPVKGEDPATVQKSMAENLDSIAKELTTTTR